MGGWRLSEHLPCLKCSSPTTFSFLLLLFLITLHLSFPGSLAGGSGMTQLICAHPVASDVALVRLPIKGDSQKTPFCPNTELHLCGFTLDRLVLEKCFRERTGTHISERKRSFQY